MCSKKISLQKSGNNDIILTAALCCKVTGKLTLYKIMSAAQCCDVTGELWRWSMGVVTWSALGSGASAWIIWYWFWGIFFLFHEFSMNKYKCKLLCTIA